MLQIFELLSVKNRFVYLFIKYKDKIKNINKNKEILSVIENYKKVNDSELFYNKKRISKFNKEVCDLNTEKNVHKLKKNLVSYQFKQFINDKENYNNNTKFYIDILKKINSKNISIKNYTKQMNNKNLNTFVKMIVGSMNLNYFLFKFKIKKSPLCEKCNKKALEDVKHRLFYCQYYKHLRKKYLNSLKVKNKNTQLNIFTNYKKIERIINFMIDMN